MVQTMPGQAAVKDYRCPGCEHLVTQGTPHVVVWPLETPIGAQRAVDEEGEAAGLADEDADHLALRLVERAEHAVVE